MKLSDAVISMMLKKGVLGEFRNFETKIDLPGENGKEPLHITIKADHLQIKLDKE